MHTFFNSRDLTSISRSLRARKTPLPIQNYDELLGGPSEESSGAWKYKQVRTQEDLDKAILVILTFFN
jgi:hypothetical protein